MNDFFSLPCNDFSFDNSFKFDYANREFLKTFIMSSAAFPRLDQGAAFHVSTVELSNRRDGQH